MPMCINELLCVYMCVYAVYNVHELSREAKRSTHKLIANTYTLCYAMRCICTDTQLYDYSDALCTTKWFITHKSAYFLWLCVCVCGWERLQYNIHGIIHKFCMENWMLRFMLLIRLKNVLKHFSIFSLPTSTCTCFHFNIQKTTTDAKFHIPSIPIHTHSREKFA